MGSKRVSWVRIPPHPLPYPIRVTPNTPRARLQRRACVFPVAARAKRMTLPAPVALTIAAMTGLTLVATGSYLKAMRVVGIKELKNRLSEYVRLAAGGETVLVSDRDQVVAELTAPREERAAMVRDAELAQAVREGWLTPPLLPAGTAPGRKPVAPLAALLEELDAARSER